MADSKCKTVNLSISNANCQDDNGWMQAAPALVHSALRIRIYIHWNKPALRQFKWIFMDNCQRTSQEEGAHGIFSHVHGKPRVTEAVQWTYQIWYCADYICRKESINPQVNASHRALTQKQRRKLQSNHFCFLFLSGHVLEYTSISRLNKLDKLIQRQHLLNKVF